MADGSPGYSGGTNPEKDQSGLTAEQLGLLSFERRWPGPSWAKERAIRAELSLTPVRYGQLVQALVADPRAVAEAPDVCRAVQTRSALRTERRAERRF